MTQTNDITALVEVVNQLLLDGEPDNISVDTYSGYVGYKPQAVIDALNAGLGYGMWGFKELSSELAGDEKATLAVSQVEVWVKDIDFHPSGWGQNRVTKGDLGDARKGAQTDAIKKALSYFSIGNRAYLGQLKDSRGQSKGHTSQPATIKNTLESSEPSPQQIKEIVRLANALGKNIERPKTFKEAHDLAVALAREYNAREAKSA